MTARTRRTGNFIVTREHRRFVEFADAMRSHGTIGLCHRPAGGGKDAFRTPICAMGLGGILADHHGTNAKAVMMSKSNWLPMRTRSVARSLMTVGHSIH